MKRIGVLTCAVTLLLIVGCDKSPSESDRSDPERNAPAVYEVSAGRGNDIETFRIRLEDPQLISQAEQLLKSGARRNVSGTLQRGNGGFNTPYGWHLAPATVGFPEITMELCDGRPTQIDKRG
jgi:hypothetical protein